jgi:hypothetical protein
LDGILIFGVEVLLCLLLAQDFFDLLIRLKRTNGIVRPKMEGKGSWSNQIV